MFAALLLAAMVDPQAGASTIAPEASELRVVVAASVYQPNGGVGVETATIPSAAPSVVYVYSRRSQCDAAATSATEPADAGFGWSLATHAVSRSAAEMTVSVDWRRLWDRRQKLTTGPAGTVQLTLHPGDRIPLDLIPNTLATDTCRAVGMSLEVRLARATDAPLPGPGAVVLPLGAMDGGAKALDADLWLVHTLPSGTQQVQHQTVRVPAAGGRFSFTTERLATTQGEVGVELTGSIQRYRDPLGAEYLLVSMARVVSGGSAPAGGVGGSTGGTLIALPGPAEVVSFEMPGAGGPAQRGAGAAAMGPGGGGGGMVARMPGPGGAGVVRGGGGGAAVGGGSAGAMRAVAAQVLSLLDGHGFSVRVRVTPVPGA